MVIRASFEKCTLNMEVKSLMNFSWWWWWKFFSSLISREKSFGYRHFKDEFYHFIEFIHQSLLEVLFNFTIFSTDTVHRSANVTLIQFATTPYRPDQIHDQLTFMGTLSNTLRISFRSIIALKGKPTSARFNHPRWSKNGANETVHFVTKLILPNLHISNL